MMGGGVSGRGAEGLGADAQTGPEEGGVGSFCLSLAPPLLATLVHRQRVVVVVGCSGFGTCKRRRLQDAFANN